MIRLFEYIFKGEPYNEKFTLETLDKVEKELGVKLPESYIQLMTIHNGGALSYNTLHSGRVPDGEVVIDDIKGIDLEEGIIESSYLVKEWELDEKLIIFSGDGNYWLSFDYRKGDNLEPSVVYIEEGTEEKPKKVAKNFQLFLKKLKEPDDDLMIPVDDHDYPVYTKEEFEKNVYSSNDYVILVDGFDQYADEDCDLTWYLLLVEKALYTKKIDRLEDTIAEALLRKLKKYPKEVWPKDLLNTITDILISPKASKNSFDQYAIKLGKKIKRMLD